MTSRDTSRVGSSHKNRFKTPMSITALESPTMENLENRFPPLLSLAFASLISPPAPVRRIRATCVWKFPNRASPQTHGRYAPSYPQTIIRDDLPDGGDDSRVGTRIVE